MDFFSKYHFPDSNFSDCFTRNKVVHVIADPLANLDDIFRRLAKACGIALIYEEDPVTGAVDFEKWTEIKYRPENSSNSYKDSNKYQPLHTDYGYFSFEVYASFFYCVEQAPFGGATTFFDADQLAILLRSINPSLLSHLQRQKVDFGRAGNPFAHNSDYILQLDPLGWKVNWNYFRAIDDKANRSLIEDFRDFLDHYVEKSGELAELKLSPGEGVFFHDRRVLHGRNSFWGDRHLNKGALISGETPIPESLKAMLV